MPVKLSRLARKADTTYANSLLVSVMCMTGSVTGSAGGSVAQALSKTASMSIPTIEMQRWLRRNASKYSDFNITIMVLP